MKKILFIAVLLSSTLMIKAQTINIPAGASTTSMGYCGGTYTGKTFNLLGDFTINCNVTFTGCTFIVAQSRKISVSSTTSVSTTATFTNCTLNSQAFNWVGFCIDGNDNTYLNITGGSISNATYGVNSSSTVVDPTYGTTNGIVNLSTILINGVTFNNVQYALLLNNKVKASSRFRVGFSNNTINSTCVAAYGVCATDCSFLGYWYTNGGGVPGSAGHPSIFSNNTINGIRSPYYLSNVEGLTIDKNTLSDICCYFSNCNQIIISNSNLNSNGFQDGIMIDGGGTYEISNNNINNFANYGIYNSSSTGGNFSIHDNKFDQITTSLIRGTAIKIAAITYTQSNIVNIYNNTIGNETSRKLLHGIDLTNIYASQINNNNIYLRSNDTPSQAWGNSIWLKGCSGQSVVGNVIKGENYWYWWSRGIVSESSLINLIGCNRIENLGIGLTMYNYENSYISENQFNNIAIGIDFSWCNSDWIDFNSWGIWNYYSFTNNIFTRSDPANQHKIRLLDNMNWSKVILGTVNDDSRKITAADILLNPGAVSPVLSYTTSELDVNSCTSRSLVTSTTPKIVPTDLMNQTSATVNNIITATKNGTVALTKDQIAKLTQIAKECPHIYGNAVYQARVILNNMDNTLDFSNACESSSPVALSTTSGISNNTSNAEFKVYPNPANDNFNVNYSISDAQVGTVQVFDVTGKLVYSQKLDANSNSINIETEKWNTGLYSCRIIVNNNIVMNSKISIVK